MMKSCAPVACTDAMDPATGWIRQPADVTVEGTLPYTDAIEFAPPEVVGGFMSANFFFDLAGTCNPVFRADVACGYAAGCEGDYLVRIENLDDPEDFAEILAPEGFDGADSVIEFDLSPFVGKNVVVVLGFFAGETAAAQDVGVFGNPRITVTD